jgi:hypothetical protein
VPSGLWTVHVLSNDPADITVSDLDSNTSGMISAAFAGE